MDLVGKSPGRIRETHMPGTWQGETFTLYEPTCMQLRLRKPHSWSQDSVYLHHWLRVEVWKKEIERGALHVVRAMNLSPSMSGRIQNILDPDLS